MRSKPLVKAIGAAFLVLCFVFVVHGPVNAKNSGIATFKLDNGLQVVVIPDRRAPVVTHMVWYRVGAADEKPGESGLAHFLEHLLFKGTAKMKPGEFSKTVARVGGRDNAFTSLDYTAYYQRVAKHRLSLVMAMEADRMNNLELTDKTVVPERKVVMEERRSRVDNRPASRLSEQMNAAQFVSHPYGKPVIGWMHEIQALNRDKAMAFYRKYYAPNNAILIVAGDVSLARVRALAEKHYGPIAAKPGLGKRLRPREVEPQAARRVLMSDPRVSNPSFRRVYLSPSYATARPGEAEAIQLLAELMGGNNTSFLFRELVVKQKVASMAGMYYSGDGLDSGSIGVYAVPAKGKTLVDVEAAVDTAIRQYLAAKIDPARLERAKNLLIAEAVYAKDSQTRMARIYGVALTTGQTIKDVQEWPQRIAKVTAKTVIRAGHDYLKLKRSTTGLLTKTKPTGQKRP